MPLGSLVLLPHTATPRDVQRTVAEHGYSRYVLTDEQGTPSAYVHLKDLLDLSTPRWSTRRFRPTASDRS